MTAPVDDRVVEILEAVQSVQKDTIANNLRIEHTRESLDRHMAEDAEAHRQTAQALEKMAEATHTLGENLASMGNDFLNRLHETARRIHNRIDMILYSLGAILLGSIGWLAHELLSRA